jgi:hypothetical protein
MDEDTRKDANRLFWIVKGHLIPDSWSDEDILKTRDSYIARLWGNHESCVHEEDFESAWQQKLLTQSK